MKIVDFESVTISEKVQNKIIGLVSMKPRENIHVFLNGAAGDL